VPHTEKALVALSSRAFSMPSRSRRTSESSPRKFGLMSGAALGSALASLTQPRLSGMVAMPKV
jgi:hypothetical protein